MREKYIALVGINWPDKSEPKGEQRAEPGELVPATIVKANLWLLTQGCVRSLIVAGEEEV